MVNFLKSIRILFLFLLPFSAYAQNSEIRGFVYDKENGEPIIFSGVSLKGTSIGATTDVNGFYSISKLKPGSYRLVCRTIGFDTVEIQVDLKANERVTKNLYLVPIKINLKEVSISGERAEQVNKVQISVTKITPKQILQIPSVGSEPDLAQYLQVIPGVIFSGDQGGQLYIRGGSPIQNKVILDGMTIYNPFHSIGLFSVFETDIIKNVDVYTGGFGARYGGRISAIMDITTRDGNKNRVAGKVGASPFSSKILLEGPLSKYKEGKPSTTFLITGKTSYLEQTSKSIYSYVDTAGLPFNFTDIYAKLSVAGNNGSKVNLFGFNFTDRVNYSDATRINWKSAGGGVNFVIVPEASSALINAYFSYTNYKITLEEQDGKPRFSSIGGFTGGVDYTYFLGDDDLRYGFEVFGFNTNYKFTNPFNLNVQQEDFTTEIAGFVSYKYKQGRLIVEPSLRGHYYASLSEFSPEPRLGAKYLLTEKLRLKTAGGFYSQNLLSANSDRDVVNLFYGFLSGTDNLQDDFRGDEVNSKLQKAEHLIVGFEWDVLPNLLVNVEGYYKNFSQLTNTNRDKIYPDNGPNDTIPDYLRKDIIVERGYARGLDFSGTYRKGNFYLNLVYSIGQVIRKDEIRTYRPFYDRRHNINLLSTYTFGKKEDWEVSIRYNFGSGFPFTQTQGIYEQIIFGNAINTNYVSENGNIGVINAELNGERLPNFIRMDISGKKGFQLSKYSKLEISAGITNILNRENIFYFDALRYTRKNQLPFLPSVGASFTF